MAGTRISPALAALMPLLLGPLAPAAHAQQGTTSPPPSSPSTPVVTDIVTLHVGYITVRNRKNLAPFSFLFVDLSGLDTKRYHVEHPSALETYDVTHLVTKSTTHSADYNDAAAALGMPSAANDPNPSFNIGGIQGNMGVSGPKMPSAAGLKKSIMPLPVRSVKIVGPTARVFLDKVRRGEQLTIRLRDVTEQVTPELARPVELLLSQSVTAKEAGGLRIDTKVRYASNQQLTDGSRRSVVQVPVLVEFPSLRQTGRANYYGRSDSLFSSNSKDPEAVVNLTYGAESNIIGEHLMRRYRLEDRYHLLPRHKELRLDASQSGQNLGFTLEAGVKRRMAGGGPDPLWDTALHSENAPVLSLNGFLEQRIRRDTNFAPRHAGVFNPGISVGMDAPPINLIATTAIPAPIQFLLSGQTWLLPFEQGSHGLAARKIEYAFRAGLLIPMPRVLGTERQLRLQYVDGAIPVSGYAHTKTFQISLEGLFF